MGRPLRYDLIEEMGLTTEQGSKLGKQVDGYQIQYSTNAKYKNSKAYTAKSNTITCKKLLSKKFQINSW